MVTITTACGNKFCKNKHLLMSFNLIGWRELFGKVFWLHFSCYKTVSCCHCHLDPPPSILKIAKN